VQAQYDIAVRFHSLSYNLKSQSYSPTVMLDFSIQLEMPFITKGSAKCFLVVSPEKDFLTNNNFEKPAVLELGPGRGEGLGAPVYSQTRSVLMC